MDHGSKEILWNSKTSTYPTPVLISPDFTKDFFIFSFASEHTVVVVLLQKNIKGQEQPIAFFSKALRDAPLKYNIMEKQAFALIKALKYFIVYIFLPKELAQLIYLLLCIVSKITRLMFYANDKYVHSFRKF